MEPVFRLATPADAYEMAVMSRYLVEVGRRGWSWPPERVAKAIRARSTLVVVAEVRSHLVGFAIMEFGEVQAHLSLLAVTRYHHDHARAAREQLRRSCVLSSPGVPRRRVYPGLLPRHRNRASHVARHPP